MNQSAAAMQEIKDLESKLEAAKRRVIEVPKSLAEEIRAAETELVNAERAKRLLDLRLDELTKQRQFLSAEVQKQNVMPNSDFVRSAKSKVIDVDNETAKLSREQDVALVELVKCQQHIAGLHTKRNETPVYAEFLRRQKEFEDGFTTVSAKALDAAATARGLLNRLEQIAREQRVAQSAARSSFITQGLICPDDAYHPSRLQSWYSEILGTIQRKFD